MGARNKNDDCVNLGCDISYKYDNDVEIKLEKCGHMWSTKQTSEE